MASAIVSLFLLQILTMAHCNILNMLFSSSNTIRLVTLLSVG